MKFQVERELHRQELMRERERKMVEDKFEQLKPAMQRVAPLTKRQIAVVSLHERLAGHHPGYFLEHSQVLSRNFYTIIFL